MAFAQLDLWKKTTQFHYLQYSQKAGRTTTYGKTKDLQIIKLMKKKAEYKKILERELTNDGVNVFLLSGEDMSALKESEQQNLCEFLKEEILASELFM